MVTRLSFQIASVIIVCIILTCRSEYNTSLPPVRSNEGPYCRRDQAPCPTKCIPLNFICDRGNDCGDGSDERGCPNKIPIVRRLFVERSRKRVMDSLSWIRRQRKPLLGWEKDTSGVLVTLYLSNPAFVNNSTVTNEVAIRDLQFKLLGRTRRKDMSLYETARYSHALLASCLNPRNFFGVNLVERMEMGLNVTKTLNPFVALALCNANGQLPNSTVIELINILRQPARQDLISQKAFAFMALTCIHEKSASFLDAIIDELGMQNPFDSFEGISMFTTDLLIHSQQLDGNFGDVYTTAIVLQALFSSEKYNFEVQNITSAFHYILSKSFRNTLDDLTVAYSLLPLFSGKSLLDLGRMNCSLSPFKEPLLPDVSVRERKIWYSIWVGDDKSIQRDMSLNFREDESTFYDVMMRAAGINKNYRFEYIQLSEGKYVTVLMGLRNNPEEAKYWYLFRLGDRQIKEGKYIYPENVIPRPNEKFVYWYKTAEFDGKLTHENLLNGSAVANSS